MTTMLTQGLHVSDWMRQNCRHTIGEWAGQPVELEPWQDELLTEAFEVDEQGDRVYRDVLLGIPRKNGKSALASGITLYLAGPDGEAGAQVILGAPSRENTREVFNQARGYVDTSPTLYRSFVTERYVIRYGIDKRTGQARGEITRAAADGKTQHGTNPHGVVVDEVHGLVTARQREAFLAWTSGSGARRNPMRWYITTAGYDLDSVLGEMYLGAMRLPDVEERRPGLVVARDRDAGFLMYWYGAPAGCAIDRDAVAIANPASWIDPDATLAELASPRMTEAGFRRLHLNQWTEAREAWFPHGTWRRLATDAAGGPAAGQRVWVGVDVGLTHDSTAVAYAWRMEDGRVGVAAKTWAVDPNTPAHVYVGERFDLELAETFIRSLAKRYDVVDIAYDPRFFERSADLLRQGGLCVAPVHQSSAQMTDVYQAFYQAVREGAVAHDGDPVLTAHVEGTAATLTDRGWKISKLHKKKRIDFVPAGAMAVWRALLGDASPLALIDPWGDA